MMNLSGEGGATRPFHLERMFLRSLRENRHYTSMKEYPKGLRMLIG